MGWARFGNVQQVAESRNIRERTEVTGIFNLRNPSRRIMALGSTQPLTEMSTRKLPRVKGRPAGA
jgi:hypothetical protein